MDKVTVFGDVHANLPALDAVFEDMEARELPENLYCLGDLVGYGTWPNEVIELMRSREIPTIMGNYDQGVGKNSDDCGCAYKTEKDRRLGERSIAWSNTHTTDENKAYLRGLVESIPLEIGNHRVLLVHGSPRRINEYLFEDRPEKSMERVIDLVEADVLVCGHTHLPYDRVLPSGRRIINAGSVGKPKDGDPRAGYITLEASRGELNVDFIRVAYDVEKAAQAIEATNMPNEYAQMLRDGKG
ncbi:MAG: metallophosphoesterase [Chloroflexi bacterium]|nr:MAG: metallophosphoesterase [Chloroflexota bacterium]MBL1192906.1 metallophosphoesterase [Chloroflexota bacterium]NOH10198.1 metallophosphoesterase family protein [Chloroflexota bacterium]